MKSSSLTGRVVAAITLVSTLFASAAILPPRGGPASFNDLGGVTTAPYRGDDLGINPTPEGATVRCAFQRLEGDATPEGLWLRSTSAGDAKGNFRVLAVKVGRYGIRMTEGLGYGSGGFDWTESELTTSGVVKVFGEVAQFIRPGVTEEYSVSVDGVRQDFLIEQPPSGSGELRVELDVVGAKAGLMANGVRLTLDDSGREFAYHRLHVTDALGRELPARWDIVDATRLAIVVDDAMARYPVRVDPTFSDADWVSVNGLPGADDTVNAVAYDEDGNLYIGGNFITVGSVVARRIAKWDGNNWSDLNGGLNGTVNAIAVSGNNVYVGGSFTTAEDGNLTNGIVISVNRVARWDGAEWQPLDVGVGGTVYALAVSGGDLYAGGTFTIAGQVSARRVAKWDGNTWSALGVGLGLASGQVNALAVSGSDLYAAGTFGQLGDGTIKTRLSKWNGSTWSALGSGIGGGTSPSVNALAVVGADLYAAGTFTIPANNIAKWNGSTWSAVGTGLGGTAYALAASGDDLYVGGAFTTAGGNPADRVAKWDGSVWSTLATGASGQVNALAVSGGTLAAGGAFTARPGVRVGVWNGSSWSSLGTGLRNPVSALAAMGGDIFLGGQFFITGVNEAINIARWNDGTLSALGEGLNGSVSAIAATGSELYVGGAFTIATNTGGTTVTVNRIAKWNGSEWSALGQGMNSNVFALALVGNDLYAGGRFTTADAAPAFGIAKWNGVAWSQVGEGLNATVNGSVAALAVMGNDLYASGVFTVATNAGGVPVTVNRIARWNGSEWSALGSGMNADVNALAVQGTTLFAGGLFNSADGVPVGRIAQWNGAGWSVLGSGTNNIFVNSLAVSGNDLYVGGTFSTVGGIVPANNIAKWDGTNWSALGTGLTGTSIPSANALTVLSGDLFVGGSFYMAGDKASQYFAKATIGVQPLPGRFEGFTYSPVTGFSCTFLDAAAGQPYRIQTTPSLSPPAWTDFTNFTYTVPIVITVPPSADVTNRFVRAVTP